MAVTQNKHKHISFEQVNTDFIYVEETGKLYRIVEVNPVGNDLRYDKPKTAQVKYRSFSIMVTHVIFMLKTGRWPNEGMLIDHKDTNPRNNKWNNLREATSGQNNFNREPAGRWLTREHAERGVIIKPNGKFAVILSRVSYGTYDTLEEANKVARIKCREIHGEFLYHPPGELIRRF